jgi:putative ABC transport system substrate-binding protein
MDRRAFIGSLAGGLLAAPLAAEAQQPGKVYKIGYLTGSSVGPLDAFKQALGEHGYIEGRNLAIESRSAEGRVEQLSPLATELARLNVHVFLVTVNRVAVAVREVAPKSETKNQRRFVDPDGLVEFAGRLPHEVGFLEAGGGWKQVVSFLRTDWIAREWGQYLDVVSFEPRSQSYQTTVVLRKS